MKAILSVTLLIVKLKLSWNVEPFARSLGILTQLPNQVAQLLNFPMKLSFAIWVWWDLLVVTLMTGLFLQNPEYVS